MFKSESLLLILFFSITLSACNANHNSIFRYREFDEQSSAVVLLDAKQRELLSNIHRDVMEDAAGEKINIFTRRFCAAPSPDFVSVFAQSLSAGGSFGQTADPKALEAALNFAFSSAESGTTIARTQTINMLRELMYRTCERFINGGIDELELSIQSIRDQRLMVSILAIEQLTGAVTPKPISITTGASGSAGLGGDAIASLERAKVARDTTASNLETAKTEYANLNKAPSTPAGAKPICDQVKEDESATPPKTPNAENKKKCDAATKTVSDLEAKLKADNEHYTSIKRAVDTGGVSTKLTSAVVGDGGLNRANIPNVERVSETVEAIVEMNFDDNSETRLFCIRALSDADRFKHLQTPQKSDLYKTCLDYLETDVNADRAERELVAALAEEKIAAVTARAEELTAAVERSFVLFWTKVDDGTGKLARSKLDTLITSLGIMPGSRKARLLREMTNGISRAQAREKFRLLRSPTQARLSQ